MMAAVYHGRNDVRVEERAYPTPPPAGWVTVRVSFCGICGTDLEELLHGPLLIPTTPHPVTGATLPLVLGHEGTGTVVATGPGVSLEVGQRVGLENSLSCGSCVYCRRGSSSLCERGATIGIALDGALAEAVNVPAAMCVPLPETLPDEAGALAEPLAVAIRAERRSGGVHGRAVDIVGAGTIGLMVAHVARARGAASIVLREASAVRREIAKEVGFAAVPPEEPAERPAAIVFECTGTEGGLDASIAATETGGTTVIVGVHAQLRRLSLLALLLEERSIVASVGHDVRHDYRPAMDLLATGAIDTSAIVTDRVPLQRVVDRGFAALQDGSGRHLKVLVNCLDP